MIFMTRQKKIESQLAQYREKIALCVEKFHQAVKQYCDTDDRSQLQRDFLEVHQLESHADDIRREIEVMMYSKALFPESRGDILGLLETMDKVPNQAEATVRMLLTHHITLPPEMRPQILEMIDVSGRCVRALLDGAEKLFTDFTNATIAVGKVDQLESDVDHMQADLIERIFAGDLPGIEKLLLRDLVRYIGHISDRAENAGDRIRIIVAKRST